MKRYCAVIMMIVASSCYGVTSYFQTPLSFLESRWSTVHYPLPWIDTCSDWEIDTLGLLFERNACKAYGENLNCISSDSTCVTNCSSNDSVTRNTVSLSQLWFGKESFLASDIFAGSQLSGSLANPLLPFVKITPNFGFNQSGAVISFNAVRKRLGCDKTWFVGGRMAMPIMVTEVNQRHAGSIEEILPDFANVIVSFQQAFNANATAPTSPGSTPGSNDSRRVVAYRLDFLNYLQQHDGTPMVQYGTVGASEVSDTFIAGQDVTTNMNQSSGSSTGRRAPLYLYKHADGIFPYPKDGLNRNSAQFPRTVSNELAYPMIDAESAIIIDASGGVLSDGQFGAFGGFATPGNVAAGTNQQQDYASNLGTNVAAQKQLFVVPVAQSASTNTWEPVVLLVQNTIDRVVEELLLDSHDGLVIQFFKDHGINFTSSDCSTGAGDTFIEFYGGKMTDCWFADALVGLRVPTGTVGDPKRIYQQTTGDNGHWASKFGIEGGVMPCSWFGIKADFFWDYTFTHNEKRAAAFKGASVRNIGPCVDARVQWSDIQFHIDFTIFNPRCPELGWDFGYEFYAKSNDKVQFCQTQTIDFNGKLQFLDQCLLSKDTNTLSHKIRLELFNRWQCFEIFLGGSYILAGRQVMKEGECHLGMKAYF